MDPLTPDEQRRLADHEATPDEEKTDAQLLDELSLRARRAAYDRARTFTLIRRAFPETRGETKVRGRLTDVVKASGFTREYVARIRDGKVAGE